MNFSPIIQELIDALRRLPGVGPKSAQRMAFNLLQHDKPSALHLSDTLTKAVNNIRQCKRCRTLCETEVCQLCNNPKRNQQLLCIVEHPSDILAIEHTACFHGVYFVLMGHLSPLDGIGPEDIGIDHLKERLNETTWQEVILALNPSVESQTTEHYLCSIIQQRGITTSRIAHGIPLGGELEYTDGNTIAHALMDRKAFAVE